MAVRRKPTTRMAETRRREGARRREGMRPPVYDFDDAK
jgi:hypothetical protein